MSAGIKLCSPVPFRVRIPANETPAKAITVTTLTAIVPT